MLFPIIYVGKSLLIDTITHVCDLTYCEFLQYVYPFSLSEEKLKCPAL